ncbi:sulfotransferase domain-containing protein [Aureisphaera galaxeae]|uniref:sulfotransferase domain-containing protein n=1 Tax=Aureisphaera galaxeae TaxID=1538023 RepID=UPI00235056E4|nr:sulfotransferase domain-containing protein [Aureisphaera galaxeae]MDC8006295.1 sulfotransferase domain-containing protein [Aureisphaera galaxeae]
MKEKKSILITGAHRSGSTWAGKIVSASPKVRYVHEPFNPGRTGVKPPFTTWFQHLSAHTQEEDQLSIHKYLSSFISTAFTDIKTTGTTGGFKLLREWRSRKTRRTVYKDPIALLSAPWMYDNLGCDVVIVIRHPAAFIASLKVKDWQFNFDNFRRQNKLVETYMKEYATEIEAYCEEPKDIIRQGILLWNCLYNTVKQYQSQYQGTWHFVTHEDLSKEPIKEFKEIFTFLNLPWSKEVTDEIENSTQGKQKDDKHKRDSKKNIHTWKQRLTEDEISNIKEGTREVWKYFYSETDW